MKTNRSAYGVGLLLAILGCSRISQSDARGAVTNLNFVDAATALDNGPQDGVFDAFTPFNFGSVDNNGYSSFRTALEFDVSGIPPGSTIMAATLTLSVNFVEGTRFRRQRWMTARKNQAQGLGKRCLLPPEVAVRRGHVAERACASSCNRNLRGGPLVAGVLPDSTFGKNRPTAPTSGCYSSKWTAQTLRCFPSNSCPSPTRTMTEYWT